ncbi:DNA repair protein RAD51 homolog 4 isoform X1 [Phoenix dactylifera]|uniref:DNA repair protein RAD51 homolog 4 isoform X1 n=2 Tax=Phoenix dactylifera TaxID=42345 RepID=A0A8B7BYK2_PHODC|nr:DNA repair protein RAD51 homolog 4 isoform X1 [Phoenix dactylifera]
MAEFNEPRSKATASVSSSGNPTSFLSRASKCAKTLEEGNRSLSDDAGFAQVQPMMEDWHQPWLNGVELLEDSNRNKHFLPTGYEGIDVLLGGGLCEGQLTEIVGSSSSGKTQVCLYSAAHVADKHFGVVMFLDTCNSFSPKRIACMVDQLSSSFSGEAKERRLKRIMSNIFCHSIFDIFALLDVLHQLEFNLKHQVTSGHTKICLLIIDSISSLLTPVLGGKGSEGRLLMVSAGIILKKLANEHNVSVLVTNHMVGGEGGILKPALGESWKSIPHVRLQLTHDQGSNICNVSILKHTFMASGRTTKFVIHG